jgi:hypothetical protein
MKNPMRGHRYPLSLLLFLTLTAQTTLGSESGLIADGAYMSGGYSAALF